MTKYVNLIDTAIGFDNGLSNLVTQSSPLYFDIVLKISQKVVVMVDTSSLRSFLPSGELFLFILSTLVVEASNEAEGLKL